MEPIQQHDPSSFQSLTSLVDLSGGGRRKPNGTFLSPFVETFINASISLFTANTPFPTLMNDRAHERLAFPSKAHEVLAKP